MNVCDIINEKGRKIIKQEKVLLITEKFTKQSYVSPHSSSHMGLDFGI